MTDSRELRKKTSSEVFLSAVERGAQSLDAEGFIDVEAKDVVVLFQDCEGEVGCCVRMCVGVVFSKSGGSLSVCRSCQVFSGAFVYSSSCLSDVCLLADVACCFVNNIRPLADSQGRACSFAPTICQRTNIVYEATCNICQQTYIGQTT